VEAAVTVFGNKSNEAAVPPTPGAASSKSLLLLWYQVYVRRTSELAGACPIAAHPETRFRIWVYGANVACWRCAQAPDPVLLNAVGHVDVVSSEIQKVAEDAAMMFEGIAAGTCARTSWLCTRGCGGGCCFITAFDSWLQRCEFIAVFFAAGWMAGIGAGAS